MPSILDECVHGFFTLVNKANQFSLWPASLDVPEGWQIFRQGDRGACLAAAGHRFKLSVEGLATAALSAAETGPDRPFAYMFERQVTANPDAPAIVGHDGELNYRELSSMTDRAAEALRGLGVGPGSTVAVILPRSVRSVAAFVAILKTGAAYLPIDISYPEERIRALLADARPALAITQSPSRGPRIGHGTRTVAADEVFMETHWPDDDTTVAERRFEHLLDLNADAPAYLIYTSGSTGRPKGVMVTHRGFIGLRDAHIDFLRAATGARVGMVASVSFDASIWEMCMALLTGATLVVLPQDVPAAGPQLADFLTGQQVTHVTIGPAVLATLPANSLPTVEVLVTAGEACSRELASKWIPGRTMFNAYGPTETTVCATISAALKPGETPLLGFALPGLRVYVLDDNLLQAREGTVAELFVAGDAVAAGYLGMPELTAERFIACPDGPPSTRMYRTGDLVRVLDGSQLEFVGRADEQFKINGFRVEPAEIVSAVLAHPAVAQAVVLPTEDDKGMRRLIAYLVWADCAVSTLSPAQLRAFLSRTLPAHLVPSLYMAVDTIPVTTNGKVDRKRLPEPIFRSDTAADRVSTITEQALCEILATVLELPVVGPKDEFFELGGTSLHMIAVLSLISERFGVELSLEDLFRAPTACGLAVVLEEFR